MEINPAVHFISGVSGVGKSTVIKRLKTLLSAEYEIHDFDERGVPENAGPDWHDQETLHWLEVASENAKLGKSTIIGGVMEPERFAKVYDKNSHPPAQLIFLHASEDVLRQRLMGRYTTPESREDIKRASGRAYDKYIEDMVADAPGLLMAFEKAGLPVINTDTKSPEEVAREIVSLL